MTMRNRRDLSVQQSAVYKYILDQSGTERVAPSQAQIADALGIVQPNVSYQCKVLVDRGYLAKIARGVYQAVELKDVKESKTPKKDDTPFISMTEGELRLIITESMSEGAALSQQKAQIVTKLLRRHRV